MHGPRPGIWLGIDGFGQPHVLVAADATQNEVTLVNTRGLTATLTELAIEQESPSAYLDLLCDEPDLRGVFAIFAAHVIESAERAVEPIAGARAALAQWRWFWAVDQAGLGPDQAAGLLGELWFLYRWVDTTSALGHWHGPEGDRHDFIWSDLSVEVKTIRSQSDKAPTHRITSLDQLDDPESGSLYLFSLQLATDPLAANTLPRLIELVEERIAGETELVARFHDLLSQAKYSPVHADRYSATYRVVSETLYRVQADFPRLTRSSFVNGLPPGVGDVDYTLDLAACATWLIAERPDEAGFLRVLQ
jgi:hypothetical protein